MSLIQREGKLGWQLFLVSVLQKQSDLWKKRLQPQWTTKSVSKMRLKLDLPPPCGETFVSISVQSVTWYASPDTGRRSLSEDKRLDPDETKEVRRPLLGESKVVHMISFSLRWVIVTMIPHYCEAEESWGAFWLLESGKWANHYGLDHCMGVGTFGCSRCTFEWSSSPLYTPSSYLWALLLASTCLCARYMQEYNISTRDNRSHRYESI